MDNSVWNQDRLGGRAGQRFALGLWDPRHPLSARAWMPGTAQRQKVWGLSPFWYALNFPMVLTQGGGSTVYDRFTVTTDFWITTLINSDQGFNDFPPTFDFTFTLWDVKSKRRYMSIPSNVENYSGGSLNASLTNNSALTNHFFPFYLRKLVRIPAGTQLQARVQTPGPASVSSFTLQVVLGGYS